MKLDEVAAIFERETGVSMRETVTAITMGAAITDFLKESNHGVAGAALGVAIGNFITRYGPDQKLQEQAMDSILRIAARQASDARA